MDGSEGVISSLRRSIYPNIKESPVPLNLRTSGSLDPGRLPLASFSSTVFRRYDIVNRQDKEGKPVLVIACDGSGSLDPNQMNMLKILANSWMYSTVVRALKHYQPFTTVETLERELMAPWCNGCITPIKPPMYLPTRSHGR